MGLNMQLLEGVWGVLWKWPGQLCPPGIGRAQEQGPSWERPPGLASSFREHPMSGEKGGSEQPQSPGGPRPEGWPGCSSPLGALETQMAKGLPLGLGVGDSSVQVQGRWRAVQVGSSLVQVQGRWRYLVALRGCACSLGPGLALPRVHLLCGFHLFLRHCWPGSFLRTPG